MDLRPADPEAIEKRLRNGLRNKSPKTSLAAALALKKTLRLGNRSDPYQPAEETLRVSRTVQEILLKLEWSYVIQTRFLANLKWDGDLLAEGTKKRLVQIMPVISPGAEADWELLERKRTTPIHRRLRIIRHWIRKGYSVGVNGEPFIPGHHTTKQFREILQRLREVGVRSYNTYNLHFNDHVAKRFHSIGINIERVWHYNQDEQWRPILKKLMAIAEEEGMLLGCPDFVNTGWDWIEGANTCCGLEVPNPSLFNTHIWKRRIQEGESPKKVLTETWEGIGDRGEGAKILRGDSDKFYTMRDVK